MESLVTHIDISTLFRYYNVVEIIKGCVSMGKYGLLCVKKTMHLNKNWLKHFRATEWIDLEIET